MERLGCETSYQNPEGTVPEEMNIGELQIISKILYHTFVSFIIIIMTL
jgi:hypothetical protein